MLRFTIRDVLWLTVVVALGLAWWIDRRALWQSDLEKTDAERKVDFLLTVLRQDGYDVEAPQGSKGSISVPSHHQVTAEMEEGHIVRPRPRE